MTHQIKYLYRQQQLSNMISYYQSYKSSSQSIFIDQRMFNQKGSLFLDYVNEIITEKTNMLNNFVLKSIQILNHVKVEERQVTARVLELEQNIAERNNTIENHVYTIKNIESKLVQYENQLFKLKQQNIELNQKIDNQEHKFKRETKQYKKTFREIQENTQSEKQIFDSIQMEYQYEKQINETLKQQIGNLKQQKQNWKSKLEQLNRHLSTSQTKIQIQEKQKEQLLEIIDQKIKIIRTLMRQIDDYKQKIKGSYTNINQDHIDQKYQEEQINIAVKSSYDPDNGGNTLIEDLQIRQSFNYLDYDYSRKSTLRQSFDDDVQVADQQVHINNSYEASKRKRKDSQLIEKPQSKIIDRTPLTSHKSDKNSILNKDLQNTAAQERINQKSPQPERIIEQFQASNSMPQREQINRTQSQSKLLIKKRVQSDEYGYRPAKINIPDLYFAHFLLTSQSVKIKQDCEQMLNIDCKQYYQQIISKRIPMHIWDDWVRQKMKIAVKKIRNQHKYQGSILSQNN